MKFIRSVATVDAQLPRSLAVFLRKRGFDVVHTLELANKSTTSDSEIRQLSIQEERTIIPEDTDLATMSIKLAYQCIAIIFDFFKHNVL